MLPPIKGFLETSFVDWPGKLAAVVFLPGCNFRCPYCHNHPLVLTPEAVSTFPLSHVQARLTDLEGWIDGAVVSGGEPTLHEGLPDLLALLRRRRLVKLDTNGSRPEVIRDLLDSGLIDAVSVDAKAPLEPLPYRRNAGPGSDPEAVARTLDLLATWGGWVEVRTTVHPELLSREELRRLAVQAGSALAAHPCPRFTIQRCRPAAAANPALRGRPAQGEEEFRDWEAMARGEFEAASGKPLRAELR